MAPNMSDTGPRPASCEVSEYRPMHTVSTRLIMGSASGMVSAGPTKASIARIVCLRYAQTSVTARLGVTARPRAGQRYHNCQCRCVQL
eukprot:scaffold234606_cov27-Prasinocladus_malaysianus.AAC.2